MMAGSTLGLLKSKQSPCFLSCILGAPPGGCLPLVDLGTRRVWGRVQEP